MKSFFTPGRVLCLVMAVLFLGAAYYTYTTDVTYTETDSMLIDRHKSGIGALTESPASQSFVAKENNMIGVDVMFSNFNKKPKTGTLTLWLTDDAGKEIVRQTWEVKELRNNAFISMELPAPQSGSAGTGYILYAASDCTDQKGVTLRQGPVDTPMDQVTLTLGDGTADTENALNLRIRYQQAAYGWMPGMTCLLIALCFVACIPMAGRKEQPHA